MWTHFFYTHVLNALVRTRTNCSVTTNAGLSTTTTNTNLSTMTTNTGLPTQANILNVLPNVGGREIVLTELANVSNGYNLLALARMEEDLAELPKSGLTKYLDHAQSRDGCVVVRYTDLGIGRLNMTVVSTDKRGNETVHEMITQASMWNWAKAECCSEYYRDVDIQNCHPELLVQMAEQHGLSCPHLIAYNQNRDALIKQSGLEKKQFKALFYSAVMYHPQCSEAQLKHKLEQFDLESEPPTFKELRAEMCAVSSKLSEQYPCYTAHAVQVKGADHFNLPGAALSYMVQTAEKKCIMALFDYFNTKSVGVGALIHDGLHLAKTADFSAHNRAACEYVKQQTGYTIRLAEKPFERFPLMKELCAATDMTDCVEHAYRILKGRIVRCDKRVWFRDAAYQWHSEKDDVIRLIAAEVSVMHILAGDGGPSISRNVVTQGQIGSKHTVAKELFDAAPDDADFIDRIRRNNVGKLVFVDGYWDFTLGEFVKEQIDCLARVPYKFPERNDDGMAECRRRIIEPILGELTESMMTWFSRGLAGNVTDKAWGAFLGERNSGKSVLIGAFEQAFGTALVATLNAETFMCSRFSDPDTAKSLGFLLQCEHHRLVFTNECDVTGDKQLNGALIKKFSSGGDSITARALYQNACTFRLSGRLCMAANDMPDVAPSDTTQTLDYFQAPRVFVPPGDARVGSDPMFLGQDDSIKDYCCSPQARAAITHLLLDAYGGRVRTSQMDTMREEFSAGSDEREKFFESFEITQDQVAHWVPVKEVAERVKKQRLSVTARRYNRWLKASGCDVGARRTTENGHRLRVVAGLKRKYIALDY